jgi:flagellar biosynthetic protein FliO
MRPPAFKRRALRSFLWFWALICAGLIAAACARAAGGQNGAPGMGTASLKALGALLLILALILLIAWLVRRYLLRYLPATVTRGDDIQILAVRILGPKRSVHLLKVEGHKLLIGSSESDVTLLKDFGEEK